MIARIRRYYARLAERYPERIDYLRARTLISLSAGMLIAATALLLAEVLVRIRGVPVPVVAYWFTGGAALLISAVLYLGHTGRMLLARLLSTALVYGLAALSLYTAGAVSYGAALLLLGILMTGMLFGKTGGLLATPFSLILFLAMIYAELNGLSGHAGPVDPQVFSLGASAIGVVIITAGLILRLFSGNLEDALNDAERVAHRLRAVADLAQIANASLRSEDLLPRLADLIQERLNIDHVQIFLADEAGEYAHLVASTGPAGQQLLARGHKLAGHGARRAGLRRRYQHRSHPPDQRVPRRHPLGAGAAPPGRRPGHRRAGCAEHAPPRLHRPGHRNPPGGGRSDRRCREQRPPVRRDSGQPGV